MRIFQNCVEALKEIERDLFEMGQRVHTETMQDKNIADDPLFETKEIMGYSFRIVDGSDKDAMLELRGLNLMWACREFAERVSPYWVNPGSAWTLREGVWEEFLKKGEGRFSYCVVPGSMIFSESGNVPIENLRRGQLVYDKDGQLVRIKNCVKLKNRGVVNIKTRHGFELVGTFNHPLFGVISRVRKQHTINKSPRWISLDELKVGDYVSVFSKYPMSFLMSSDLAFLVGLVLSDGSIGSGGGNKCRVSFVNKNVKLADLFIELCSRLGFSSHKSYNVVNGSWQCYMHKEDSRRFVVQLNGSLAHVDFWAESNVLSFLAGFCEGDGYICIKRRKIDFCTSPNHLEQSRVISVCLLKLGLLSTIKQSPRGKFGQGQVKVSICGDQVESLLSRLPLRVKKVVSKLNRVHEYSGKGRFVTTNGYLMDQIIYKGVFGKSDVYDIETKGNFVCNGLISHNTYNERFRTQLPLIIEELQKHPNTRQAVMTIYEGPLDVPKLGVLRVPCSLSYQFLIREGELNIIYVMRSTDLMTHFPYDVWLAITMMEHVASKIGARPGSFTMFAGSLHLYRKDVEGRNIF